MAVRSTQCQNRAVRSTQGGRGSHPQNTSFITQVVEQKPFFFIIIIFSNRLTFLRALLIAMKLTYVHAQHLGFFLQLNSLFTYF